MTIRVGFLLLLVSILGCEETKPSLVQMNPRIADFQIRRVAILPFEDAPGENKDDHWDGVSHVWIFARDTGQIVSDVFTTEMMRISCFDYMERSQIRRVLQEQSLTMTTLVKEKTAAEIGEILGADAIILGSVSSMCRWYGWAGQGCTAFFTVRMVETKGGTVLWSATANGRTHEHSDQIRLVRDLSSQIAQELRAKTEPGSVGQPEPARK